MEPITPSQLRTMCQRMGVRLCFEHRDAWRMTSILTGDQTLGYLYRRSKTLWYISARVHP